MKFLIFLIFIIALFASLFYKRAGIYNFLEEHNFMPAKEEAKVVTKEIPSPSQVKNNTDRLEDKKVKTSQKKEFVKRENDLAYDSNKNEEDVIAELEPVNDEEEIAELYPMPTFPSLDEKLNNWQNIPKERFPKKVTISKTVNVTNRNGNKISTIPGGTSLIVTEQLADQKLAIKTNSDDQIASVSISDTNFKEVMTNLYIKWQEKQKNMVLKNRSKELSSRQEARRKIDEIFDNAQKDIKITSSTRSDRSIYDENVPNGFETSPYLNENFNPLIESLENGDLYNITIADIYAWRWNGKESFEGEEYDTASVLYTADTVFGLLKINAKALIKDKKVVRWLNANTGIKL